MTEPKLIWSHEATELIYEWLRTEFPTLILGGQANDGACTMFQNYKDQITDIIFVYIDKDRRCGLIIYIRGLDVVIYLSTPRATSKIREVNLISPTSIDSIQQIIKHLMQVTLSPWM